MKIKAFKNIVLAITILSFYACNNDETNITFNENESSITIDLDSLIIGGMTQGVIVNGEYISPDSTWQATSHGDGIWIFEREGQWRITQTIKNSSDNEEWLQISTEVENLSASPVPIDYVIPFKSEALSSVIPFERYLSEALLTWTYSGMWHDPVEQESYSFAGFSDPYGESAMVMGFVDLQDAVYTLDVDMGDKIINSITAKCDREGINLNPGEKLKISDLVIKHATSLTESLKEYGWIVVDHMGRSKKEVMDGWCSWYYYYGTLTYDDLMSNMEAIHDLGLADVVDVIQIDAGWYNLTKEKEQIEWKVRGDWLNDHGFKFPMGMKSVADEIKEQGFVPGIWTAPFLGDPLSDIYQEHPEYFVHRNGRQTMSLDLSDPTVLGYVEEVFEKLAHNDGYEYFKIDFLGAGLAQGDNYDPTKTTVENFRTGMNVIRDVVGDESYILACGAPLPYCIGIVDGMRVGHDIATFWQPPGAEENANGFGGHGVQMATNQVIWRQWMNRIFWHNDPDGVITRDYDIKMRETYQPAMKEEDAGLWARITWFTGGMGLYSENIPELYERSPERYQLMANSVPANEVSPDVVDWYVIPKVSIMKSDGDPVMIGVFNLGEQAVNIDIPAKKLGLSGNWEFTEKINGETFQGSGDTVNFPELPAHGGRIWVLD